MSTLSFQSPKSLETILNDCSIDAIIAFDADKKIIAWNKTAEKIYGKSKKQVLNKPLLDMLPSMSRDQETLDAIDTALNGSKSFVPPSNDLAHRKQAENHFIPLKDEEEIKGVMNLSHDVAHRIKNEELLWQLNHELEIRLKQLTSTTQELANFTYLTSEKIKLPTRQVYLDIEKLISTEGHKLSNGGKAIFRRIQSAEQRMELLLDDMLKLAHISILERPKGYVALDLVIKKVIQDVKRKSDKNIQFAVGDLCRIRGHEEYLYLLFSNLIDNAVKFNGLNPHVSVTCESVMVDSGIGQEEYFRVTVTDDGIGFEEAVSEKIFTILEKLHEKKFKGSGMGLAVARKVMEAHNGFIRAESTVGLGSSFHCYFKAE